MEKNEELQKLIDTLSDTTIKYNELIKGYKTSIIFARNAINNLQTAVELIKSEKTGYG